VRALVVVAVLAGAARAEVVAIEGATVWTEPGKKLEGATVVMDGALITAVGVGVKVPAAARRVDARGKVVTAGFIDAMTTLGLVEIELEDSANDGTFGGGPGEEGIHAAYRVTDGYNVASVAIPVARTGGVTSVVAAPRGGLVSGSSAWVTLAEAATVADVLVRAPLAMHVTLGDSALPSARGSRGMAVERLRELLDDAAAFARRKGEYERNQTRRFAASRLDLAALAEVTAGRQPLVVWAQRASDIQAALALGRELGARVVIAGGTEAWRVAPELARAKVGVILDPMENLPWSFETLQVRDDAAARLAAAGVTVALSTLGDYANVRTLRQRAGVAVGGGMPWDAALAAVTSGPAALFGPGSGKVPPRGRLAAKAAADVVVWSGDPLSWPRAPSMSSSAGSSSVRTPGRPSSSSAIGASRPSPHLDFRLSRGARAPHFGVTTAPGASITCTAFFHLAGPSASSSSDM